MRVLLMTPYDPGYGRDMPDLGLGYLAASLREAGHEVVLSLRSAEFPSESDFVNFVRKGRFDAAGIKVVSCSILAAKRSIGLLRSAAPDMTIVLGGPHVSGVPDQVFNLLGEADYAFHGEAERGLAALLGQVSTDRVESLDSVPNLVWRNHGSPIVNPGEWVDDLDSLPFPAWDLMPPASFAQVPFNGYSRCHPIAPIILTRGCPYRCTFCAAPLINGRRVRARSADNVMEEIRLLTGRFGVRELQFYDSNCSHPRSPLAEVCRRILLDRIDITWSVPNGIRLDCIDTELARLMRRSGCYQVNVGIESGSPRIQKGIKKGLTLELARRNVQVLHDAGIEVVGLFMLGFPGETYEEMQQTVALAMDLPLSGASFSVLSPLPGTAIYRDLFGEAQMDIAELDGLDFIHYRNNLSEVPYELLRRTQKHAYLRFHLRPRIMYHVLKNMNNLDKMGYVLRRIYLNAFSSHMG